VLSFPTACASSWPLIPHGAARCAASSSAPSWAGCATAPTCRPPRPSRPGRSGIRAACACPREPAKRSRARAPRCRPTASRAASRKREQGFVGRGFVVLRVLLARQASATLQATHDAAVQERGDLCDVLIASATSAAPSAVFVTLVGGSSGERRTARSGTPREITGRRTRQREVDRSTTLTAPRRRSFRCSG